MLRSWFKLLFLLFGRTSDTPGREGTPIFYLHMGLADLFIFWFKILIFNIFGVTSKLDNFYGLFLKLSAPVCVL